MRLDAIVQASVPTTEVTNVPVNPTLVIGLGGTGKEVLLRLRRKIVEHYGSLSRLPFLEFMHLDTDGTPTARQQYDMTAADDPLFDEIQFKTIERIDLTVVGGTGKYIQHINSYPQVKRWLPSWGKMADFGDLSDGAGQVRLASRLGFFENFVKITDRLEQCRRNLKDASIPQRSAPLGFQVNSDALSVVIVASLAGGTGSGTFLDMGFLVRRHFPSAERIGILLMPGFFAGYPGAERVRANGYAALMELNHYTFGHSFIGDWGGGSRSEAFLPPPFTNTYLIDGENEAGLGIASSGKELDAYRMVAEVLFQDYSIGEFAGMKRATRVNLANFNLSVYTHNFLNDALRQGSGERHKKIVGDTYTTRFGSFGLATISFPTERVQNAAGCRLAIKVLDHWQKTAINDPLERLFTTFLIDENVKFAQGSYERRDGGGTIQERHIEDALMVYDSGAGKTFASYLWQKAQTVRTDLQAAPNGMKADRLAEHRNEMERFLAKEDSENAKEWGVGIRHIDNNMRAYITRIKQGLEKKAAELADDAQFGVNYTLSLLRELKSLLRNENFWYLHDFERQFNDATGDVQETGNDLEQLQMDIARHEREHLFRTEDLKRDYQKLTADHKDDEDRGAFFNHYRARVWKQVAKRGRMVCEAIDKFLGPDAATGDGLIARYYGLRDSFDNLKKRIVDKEQYYSKQEKSDLVLSLFREGDIDNWYRNWVGEGDDEENVLQSLGSQILSTVFNVPSVTAALVHIQQTPVQDVEAGIFEHCRKFILSREQQPDALSLLWEVRDREEMVRQAYRLAKVWVAPAERGLEHVVGLPPVTPGQRPCFIGVDDSSRPRLEEFKNLVGKIQKPGDSPVIFKKIGEQHRGTIVFYNELAGVPAFYPKSVTAPSGLRAAYDANPEKEELHTDKNRFQFSDLIPKENAEAARYADSLRAFVLARLLGLLRVREIGADQPRSTFRYGYIREESLNRELIDLGEESHAVDFLYRDKESDHLAHRRVLLQMIEKATQTLRKHGLLAVYRLVLEFYLQKIYPPQDMSDLGVPDLTATRYSPEYAVLHEARAQLARTVAQSGEQEQFSNALFRLTGKKLGEPLTYDEYKAALGPYCTTAGKFAEQTTNAMVLSETVWHDVLALDLSKVEKTEARLPIKPIERPAPAAAPDKKFGERPCPKCQKPVDRRATFCTHCRQTIARLVACPHCEEPRVPDDLEFCWKCGAKMRDEEQIDCPRCFSWRGYEKEFPCPNCGFDPKSDEQQAWSEPVAEPAAASSPEPVTNVFVPPSASVVPELVQCPICYSKVAAGAQCSVCDGVLEAT